MYKLVVFETIAIILEIITMLLNEASLFRTVLVIGRSIVFYPLGGMWYIQAVIIAVIILIPIIESKKEWVGIVIGIPLYAYALVSNRYYFIIKDTLFEKPIQYINKVIASPRNGVFYGMLFVAIGILIAKYWNFIESKRKISFLAFVFSYIALICEFVLIQGKEGVDDASLHIAMVFASPLLFINAAQHNISLSDTRLIRNCSTAIYLLHSPIINILQIICLIVSNREISCIELNACLFVMLVSVITIIFKNNKYGKIYRLVT